MEASSRNSSPDPDLVFVKLILTRVPLSGGSVFYRRRYHHFLGQVATLTAPDFAPRGDPSFLAKRLALSAPAQSSPRIDRQ